MWPQMLLGAALAGIVILAGVALWHDLKRLKRDDDDG